jgi:hypothetical protein
VTAHDPLDGAGQAEVDARFAEIVSGFGESVGPDWQRSIRQVDGPADPGGSDTMIAPDPTPRSPFPSLPPVIGPVDRLTPRLQRPARESTPDADPESLRLERERRRELRRAERAAELEAFHDEQAEVQRERDEDQEHYERPEPPPLPRPKSRTICAVLLMAVGVVVMVWPNLLAVAPNLALIIGALGLIGGFVLLVAGLRGRPGDPHDGWDDGAQV